MYDHVMYLIVKVVLSFHYTFKMNNIIITKFYDLIDIFYELFEKFKYPKIPIEFDNIKYCYLKFLQCHENWYQRNLGNSFRGHVKFLGVIIPKKFR